MLPRAYASTGETNKLRAVTLGVRLYLYSSPSGLVSDARASCEERGRPPAPRAALGGHSRRDQTSPSPAEQSKVKV